MIRHCVFIRFKVETAPARRKELFGEIATLKEKLPGMLAVHIGANVSPEVGMDKGYADGFVVDFLDGAARDAYLSHPNHQEIGGRLVEAAQGGIEGIFVYDLQIGGVSSARL